MKAASFRYVRAETVEHALDVLAEHGSDAKVIAGGQSLVPMMNLRLARPAILVDVARTPQLSGIELADGVLRLGATTTQNAVLVSQVVKRASPLVGDALRYVGHVAIRNRGTIGGSIAHADPAAELPAVALALDADVVLCRRGGERVIAARDFFKSYFETSVGDDELLTEVQLPASSPDERTAFVEVARRHGDYALVGAVARIRCASNLVDDARIVLFGVGSTPVRLDDAAGLLAGTALDDGIVAEVARAGAASVNPPDDVHGSREYRRRVAGVLIERALTACRDGGAPTS